MSFEGRRGLRGKQRDFALVRDFKRIGVCPIQLLPNSTGPFNFAWYPASYLKLFRELAKVTYYLRHVHPSICLQILARLPLNGFPGEKNSYMGTSNKIYWENTNLVETGGKKCGENKHENPSTFHGCCQWYPLGLTVLFAGEMLSGSCCGRAAIDITWVCQNVTLCLRHRFCFLFLSLCNFKPYLYRFNFAAFKYLYM